jgi:hypothetical protein
VPIERLTCFDRARRMARAAADEGQHDERQQSEARMDQRIALVTAAWFWNMISLVSTEITCMNR